MNPPKAEASVPNVDDLDAGWEDEDELDEPEEPEEPAPPGMTPEEREARAAARKEKARAKATAKRERRKARVLAAADKQKKGGGKRRTAPPPALATSAKSVSSVERSTKTELRAAKDEGESSRADHDANVRRDWRRMAIMVAIVVAVGGAVMFFLMKK